MILIYESKGMPVMTAIPENQSFWLRAMSGENGYELHLFVEGEDLDVVYDGLEIDSENRLFVLSMIISKAAVAIASSDNGIVDLRDIIRFEVDFWATVALME